MYQDLVGKVALVTGANAGIGKAAALLFARRGAHVAVAARRATELEEVVREIEAAGGTAVAFPTDISREADVEALVTSAVGRFGRIDAAFNNAGVMGQFAAIDQHSAEAFDQVVGTNLRGTWLCCKAELAQFARQGTGGAIVNTSSWLSQGAIQGSTLYTMSKAGMDGMVRALAIEAGAKGVRINNVNPGVIDTDMLRQNTDDESRKPFLAHTPLGRVGTPEEVADMAVWLCSDLSRFVTGQSILIDGGYAIAGHRG